VRRFATANAFRTSDTRLGSSWPGYSKRVKRAIAIRVAYES
jgi:hypothetical protein